ncbi:hypothetical protein Tco_0724063 [Tanacetum coccineum]
MGLEGVNGNVKGEPIGEAPDSLDDHCLIIANLLPAQLAQGFIVARMVAVTEPKTMQKAVHISGVLTDEAVRNESIKKVEKRGNMGEPSKDKNGRDNNKRTRTGNVFATIVNPAGRENTGTWPKCTTCNSYHAPEGPYRTCFNCNSPGYLAKDYRSVPRNVNHVNARNLTVRACISGVLPTMYRVSLNLGLNRAHKDWKKISQIKLRTINRGQVMETREPRLGVGHSCCEEQRNTPDPNIKRVRFTLNNHFSTTLFDSGAEL